MMRRYQYPIRAALVLGVLTLAGCDGDEFGITSPGVGEATVQPADPCPLARVDGPQALPELPAGCPKHEEEDEDAGPAPV